MTLTNPKGLPELKWPEGRYKWICFGAGAVGGRHCYMDWAGPLKFCVNCGRPKKLPTRKELSQMDPQHD